MFCNAKIGDQFKSRKGLIGVYCGMYLNTFHVVKFKKLGGRHYYNDGRYYKGMNSEDDIVEKIPDHQKKEIYEMPCCGSCTYSSCEFNVNHNAFRKLLFGRGRN